MNNAERLSADDNRGLSGGAGAGFTHAELVERAGRWLRNQVRCTVVETEVVTGTQFGECPDAIGWRHGRSYLVECKASRGDFHADRRKRFRACASEGVGDFRYYLTAPGLLTIAELPEDWGLLEVRGRVIRQLMESLHFLTANHDAERQMLTMLVRRASGEFNHGRFGFATPNPAASSAASTPTED